MKILDGRIVRDKIAKKLRSQISDLRSRPKLVILQVGDLAESNAYIRQKILFGQKIGAIVNHKKFKEDIDQENLKSYILNLNSDNSVNGIILQMSIPKHLDKDEIIDAISPAKDVDGLTSTNLKLLWENRPEAIVPATTRGILTLLDYYKIPIATKKVVVVGRSFLVGKPTAFAFLNRNATVTICHKETKNLKQETRNADILIIAVGKPNLITKDHVKPGQVIIDVGINVIEKQETTNGKRLTTKPELENQQLTINNKPSTKLVGDVDFEKVQKIVSAITPVPGGIGPMTVASLFENLLEAYTRQSS